MKPEVFKKTYLHYAEETERKTGFPALAILAQAALESGWGTVAPGNMFFGVKDTDGINGNEQLVNTVEYSSRANLKFPVILEIKPVMMWGRKMFKYMIKDYFRKYATPEESFTDHAVFLLKNPRYKASIGIKDPYEFVEAIAAAGYATDPNYATTLKKIIKMLS